MWSLAYASGSVGAVNSYSKKPGTQISRFAVTAAHALADEVLVFFERDAVDVFELLADELAAGGHLNSSCKSVITTSRIQCDCAVEMLREPAQIGIQDR